MTKKTATTATTVRVDWHSGRRFDVRGATGAPTIIDAHKQAGAGPVDTLLGALAACSAIDVLAYFEKRRTPAARLEVVVTAERRAAAPRRVMRAQLEFRIDGEGIDAEHAERSIQLSLERYCSVAASLARDIVISTVLVLNGTAHRVRPRHIARGSA